MCLNLGADESRSITAQLNYTPSPNTADSKDANVYGDLYQWGRIADGHQLRGSQSYLTNGTGSQSSPVANANLDANGQVNSTFAAYKKFIKNDTSPYDWHAAAAKNDDLWNFSKYPSNNPCPSGWRVPTTDEWQSIVNGDPSTINPTPLATVRYYSKSGNMWTYSDKFTTNTTGWLITPSGSSEPTLFLPAAGGRMSTNSVLNYVGQYGYYWSTSVNGIDALDLSFAGSMNIHQSYPEHRTYGFSVRCIAE